MVALTRCATPKVGSRKGSTYTVLGFLGYGAASLFCALLASAWDFTIGMRLVSIVAPPIAFIVVVTIATAAISYEVKVTMKGVTSSVPAKDPKTIFKNASDLGRFESHARPPSARRSKASSRRRRLRPTARSSTLMFPS